MARKPRAEIEGGLYHIIARAEGGRTIFGSDAAHQKFLELLAAQKERFPFYFYAYCLMPDHFHLLMERQTDNIGHVMHRLITGLSHFYNKQHRKTGTVFHGRHKAILCQSDLYLDDLVRYIHLNPVRSKIVRKAENYKYSSQRAYLGLEPAGVVDVEPVLRHFGARNATARKRFAEFVRAGIKLGHNDEFYRVDHGRILGSEEFVDKTVRRIADLAKRAARKQEKAPRKLNRKALIAAVEKTFGMRKKEFAGPGKSAHLIEIKEALIVVGRQAGAGMAELAKIIGVSNSVVGRRYDAAMAKMRNDDQFRKLVAKVTRLYRQESS